MKTCEFRVRTYPPVHELLVATGTWTWWFCETGLRNEESRLGMRGRCWCTAIRICCGAPKWKQSRRAEHGSCPDTRGYWIAWSLRSRSYAKASTEMFWARRLQIWRNLRKCVCWNCVLRYQKSVDALYFLPRGWVYPDTWNRNKRMIIYLSFHYVYINKFRKLKILHYHYARNSSPHFLMILSLILITFRL
jgi:hypothetical protein